MRKIIYTLFFLMCISSMAFSQVSSIFENQNLGIAFEASSQWTRLSSGNSEVLELINPNNNLKVKMYFKESDLSASEYLKGLLREEGLSHLEGPFELVVDNRKSSGLIGLCNEMHRPVRILLLAINYDNGFYVVRFKCPDECFPEHQKQMDKLISSVRLMDEAGSYLFYADHRTGS
jgi:hypothetical protein